MIRKGFRGRQVVRWGVGLFALSQVLLATVVDQAAPAVRDPEFACLEHKLRDRIAEHPNRPVALFGGSSRVAHGFDAGRAAGDEPVVLFNFGVPGSGPFFQELMLERLRQSGIRPDVLFLEVMLPFYNAAGPWGMDNGLLDGARLSFGEARGLLDYNPRSRTGPLKRWAHGRLLPGYRHQAEVRDQLGLDVYPDGMRPDSPARNIDEYGFRPKEESAEKQEQLTAQAHRDYDRFYTSFRLDPYAWERLVRTITAVRTEGAQVVVVLMPEGSEFRSLSSPEVEAAQREMLRRIRVENGVPVIDARDWLPDSAFFDQHHCRPAGAAAFADRFREEVLQKYIGSRQAAGPQRREED
jgi:hypothetical protein